MASLVHLLRQVKLAQTSSGRLVLFTYRLERGSDTPRIFTGAARVGTVAPSYKLRERVDIYDDAAAALSELAKQLKQTAGDPHTISEGAEVAVDVSDDSGLPWERSWRLQHHPGSGWLVIESTREPGVEKPRLDSDAFKTSAQAVEWIRGRSTESVYA